MRLTIGQDSHDVQPDRVGDGTQDPDEVDLVHIRNGIHGMAVHSVVAFRNCSTFIELSAILIV